MMTLERFFVGWCVLCLYASVFAARWRLAEYLYGG